MVRLTNRHTAVNNEALDKGMYRRPKFLEMLLEIRREMALEADYDIDLFVGRVLSGHAPAHGKVLAESVSMAEQTDTEIEAVLRRSRKVRKV
jgi:hypothetical protein